MSQHNVFFFLDNGRYMLYCFFRNLSDNELKNFTDLDLEFYLIFIEKPQRILNERCMKQECYKRITNAIEVITYCMMYHILIFLY